MRRLFRSTHLLLAFVGGFADAGCYVFAGCFAGHVTGNMLLAAISIVRGQWDHAADCASAVLCFATGTFLGSLLKSEQELTDRRRLTIALGMEIALLVAAAFIGRGVGALAHHAFVILTSIGLGLQNGSFNKAGTASVRTTYITGMTTDLLGTLAKNPSALRDSVLPLTLICFCLGGMAGGCGILREGSISLLLAAGVLSISTVGLWKPLRPTT